MSAKRNTDLGDHEVIRRRCPHAERWDVEDIRDAVGSR
jgi:hypothetical protein